MKQDFYYMTFPNEHWNRSISVEELFKKLKNGWKIMNVVGTSDFVHFILTKKENK